MGMAEMSGVPVREEPKEEKVWSRGERKKLPSRRGGYNQKVRIGGTVFYVRTGEYEDGTLGEIFLDCAKAGSSLRAMMNAMAMLFSMSLQYGVPLQALVKLLKNFSFLPSGHVDGDPRLENALSILDYIVRELELTYLTDTTSIPSEPNNL
jgi:ribonucleoside-diphosphate reductase alpha chain